MTNSPFFGNIAVEHHRVGKGETIMTSTGIVRRIDSAGRFVLPIELRRTLDIEDTDSLEIFLEDNTIVLKKYQPACIFCNNADDIVYFNNKRICTACLEKIKTQL